MVRSVQNLLVPLTRKATKMVLTITTMRAMTISTEKYNYDNEEEGDVVTTKTMILRQHSYQKVIVGYD